jgi:putative membrane protein
MADARDGDSYSGAAGIDGLRQDSSLSLPWFRTIFDFRTQEEGSWPAPMISHAALNASLNGTSAVLLTCGYAAIRARRIAVHKAFMIAAFLTSTAFLISYLLYHYRVGHVAFQGQGWIRPVYFTLLLTHTVLAIVIVPMIIVTLRRAWLEKFDKHRIIARWTLPLWMYVSVTGVIVYLMVYQIYSGK